MVWLGWRKDETGDVIPNVPNAVKSGSKRSKAQAPKTKTYDDDFGAAWTDHTVAKMIADEVEAMMAKHALAPSPSAPIPRRRCERSALKPRWPAGGSGGWKPPTSPRRSACVVH